MNFTLFSLLYCIAHRLLFHPYHFTVYSIIVAVVLYRLISTMAFDNSKTKLYFWSFDTFFPVQKGTKLYLILGWETNSLTSNWIYINKIKKTPMTVLLQIGCLYCVQFWITPAKKIFEILVVPNPNLHSGKQLVITKNIPKFRGVTARNISWFLFRI